MIEVGIPTVVPNLPKEPGNSNIATPTSDTEPPSPGSIDPAPEISERGDVPLNFFYSGSAFVYCLAAPIILDVYKPPPQGPGAPLIPNSAYQDWPSLYPRTKAGRRSARQHIFREQAKCRTCTCTEDLIMEKSDPPRGRRNLAWCRTTETVNICVVIYGCFCTVKLANPEPTLPGIPLHEYYDTIFKIPPEAFGANPDWAWDPSGYAKHNGGYRSRAERQHQASQLMEKDDYLDFLNPHSKELAPGTKEPYYLEGPSRSFSPDVWRGSFRGGSSFGEGGLPATPEGVLNRRASSGEEVEDDTKASGRRYSQRVKKRGTVRTAVSKDSLE
ncbi:hypothetical protein TWF730_001521 [Orbilia blumenaviensis]|uniref:Uncharacterized protein n=1 Tax=Orbilia blumenaviensis TaxID=1796055 RepID=A0AAV9UJ55_9PEZI